MIACAWVFVALPKLSDVVVILLFLTLTRLV